MEIQTFPPQIVELLELMCADVHVTEHHTTVADWVLADSTDQKRVESR